MNGALKESGGLHRGFAKESCFRRRCPRACRTQSVHHCRWGQNRRQSLQITPTWTCAASAEAEAPSQGTHQGSAVLDAQGNIQLRDANLDSTPEELNPLKEALERALLHKDEAAGIREALEAEAQEVAQLAIGARDNLQDARLKVDEAVAEAESAIIVKHKLTIDLDDLRATMDQDDSTAGAKGDGEDVTTTLDMREVFGDDEDAPLSNIETKVWEKARRLEHASVTLEGLEQRVKALENQLSAAEVDSNRAEEVAAAAMKAAEGAVQEEMEAASVAQATQTALTNALADLTKMEIRFQENAERSNQERTRARISAKEKAEAATSKALRTLSAPLLKQIKPETDRTELKSDGAIAAALAEQAAASVPTATSAQGPRTRVTQSMDGEYADEATTSGPTLAERLRQGKWVAAVAVAAVAIGLALVIFQDSSIVQGLYHQVLAAARIVAWIPGAIKGLWSKLPLPEIPHGEAGLIETIWLLLTSVVAVPLVCALPGGSPVLGFLAGGALIGPHALGIIKDVEGVRHLAELGVVFLLFNIGLELSLERLRSMQKYVFGMGTAQFVFTLSAVAVTASVAAGVSGPAAIILGGGLALSSTAVAMQVLQDRGETGSRHGRATFAILLLQDLAVVVLLMLVPLLAPQEGAPQGAAGMQRIAKALGIAAIKAITCIVSLIAGGRVLLRPMYRFISKLGNEDIFQATTILVVLGTSMMTQLAGLSLALGAFLAGLLLAETEFALQVESDIAPYKGLLMGLFFMTVGMEISVGLFFAKWQTVLLGIIVLIVGKTAVMAAIGGVFGLSKLQSVRAGLLLAAGGEFAFVTFQEAIVHGILPADMVRQLFLVVALSMAATPFLADFGQRLGKMFEKGDMKAMQPDEGASKEMRDHVIIAGFGRVGQIIGQLLSERLIPFVALDVQAERVQAGQELDLPVYFGDAGSGAVLHSVGAHRAACAVITLDTPGANYRTVWALHKNFPNVKIYVRAHDVHHGLNLEKAGATAVVPETLEPSLQLAAAVLSQLNMPQDEVTAAIQQFRRDHISELQVLSNNSGSSLGYGFGGSLAVKEKDISDEGNGKVDLEALKPQLA